MSDSWLSFSQNPHIHLEKSSQKLTIKSEKLLNLLIVTIHLQTVLFQIMIKKFFFFTKGEKTGIMILLFLIGIIFAVNASFNYISPSKQLNTSKYEQEVKIFKQSLKPKISDKQNKNKEVIFLAQKEEVFEKKEYSGIKNPRKSDEKFSIEINQADTTDLKRLKGIGSVYSKRIIKFRNYLGGFYSLEQLKEVYGIDEELFLSIKKHLTIDARKIRQFNVNSDTFCYKFRHPYLEKEEIKALLKQKKEGTIIQKEEIKKLLSLSEEKWKKLSPYIAE